LNKLFILLFFFIPGLNSAFAQKDIGIKFGLNISNVNHSNENNFTNLLDFNSGVVVRFKISDKLLLNTEVLASTKGFNSLLIPQGTIANQLTYLSFPVLIHYYATDKIYFQLGPEFNFLTKAKMKNSAVDESVTKDYNRFDFSIAGGVGFKILKVLNLETRYSFGLSQINKEANNIGTHKNRTLQVNLIYLLRSKE
jgi:outer membrane immunogenic protein